MHSAILFCEKIFFFAPRTCFEIGEGFFSKLFAAPGEKVHRCEKLEIFNFSFIFLVEPLVLHVFALYGPEISFHLIFSLCAHFLSMIETILVVSSQIPRNSMCAISSQRDSLGVQSPLTILAKRIEVANLLLSTVNHSVLASVFHAHNDSVEPRFL